MKEELLFRDFVPTSFMDGPLFLRFFTLVRSRQAEIIIVKCLIQGHNNV